MGSHHTLDRHHPKEEPAAPSRPVSLVFQDLKQGEWKFRRGMIDDDQLLQLRAGCEAVNLAPPSGHWVQPTVAELRAMGHHGEADRILSEQRWFATGHSEIAFDQLNPTFGIPADTRDSIGHRDLHQRERGLVLGVRVTVHDSRQNDRDPVIWQPGQDYRMADALHAARTHPARTHRGPERVGPER